MIQVQRRAASMRCFVSLVAALSCVLPLCSCDIENNKSLTGKSVERFHASFASARYQEIYDDADPELKAKVKQEEFHALLLAVHQNLGSVKKASIDSYMEGRFTDRGLLVSVVYDVEFTHGGAQELFVWRLRDGRPRLFGYNISSPALKSASLPSTTSDWNRGH